MRVVSLSILASTVSRTSIAFSAFAFLVVCGAISGCRQIGMQPRPIPMNHDEVTTTSGVRWEDRFRGKGPAAESGDELVIDYTLWLEDGRRIDSTLDRGVPITVRLGTAFLVPGLNDGLLGIQADGQRRVVVPPNLGYGATGVEGLVPPDATLVFEVHALELHPRTGK